ncbi:MAG: UDP-N-acetylmuramoyl-L-alanine--D-glutamate ligase [Candidatus Omnitrophica bacterium]|nr:UDP-N-acetylmuramoyl-L-alanine--D-glutamate ligase [Candidatus Omnitrophota bacterium]MCM8829259.1 UDP-N-acetylmuramoyl-L-alanine--D-glutamate ligase [Candidatus Omnitrophota bacterium]
MKIKGKRFLVVGLGETGFDSALVLKKFGADVRVTEIKNSPSIDDKKKILEGYGIVVETGRHSVDFVKWADSIVPGPGVPLNAEPIVRAKENNKRIISEIEIAYQLSPSKKIIAITGTNGKTTTVSFIDLVFEKAKIPHITCGNIGNSFIGELEKINRDTWIIIEVSSFQLEYIEKFRAHIGVLLNIAQDHLDYYSSFSQYIEAKRKLFASSHRDDWAITNYENTPCRQIAERLECNKIFFSSKRKIDGIFLSDGFVFFKQKKLFSINQFQESRLTGIHNLENIMAAAAITEICGISNNFLSMAISDFTPHRHRLEKVAAINGITFIDDSKATNVDAVCRALESFSETGNIILILGGKDKGISFQPLVPFLKGRVKMILLIGEAAKRIADELSNTEIEMRETKNFEQLVRIALAQGKPGDVVLLSPGCSSFDMFTSYSERGDVFQTAVKNLL